MYICMHRYTYIYIYLYSVSAYIDSLSCARMRVRVPECVRAHTHGSSAMTPGCVSLCACVGASVHVYGYVCHCTFRALSGSVCVSVGVRSGSSASARALHV